jgi:transposase-like protein
MKTCPICLLSLNNDRFYKNADREDSLSVRCKDCTRSYEASPERRAKRTWNTIKHRAGKQQSYEHVEVRMTRDEFLAWSIPEYAKWIPKDQPSLDRIDPRGHYELGNLRIINRRENSRLQRTAKNVHATEGMAWCTDCSAYLQRDSFWRCKSSYNKLQHRCKPCQMAAIRHYKGRVAL